MQWDTIVVFSGGMDSTVLLADTLTRTRKVAAVSFDYGSKHNDRELPLAQTICEAAGIFHRVVALPFIEELFASNLLRSGGQIPDAVYDKTTMQQTVVPFRNGIMLSVAVGLAESMGAGQVLLASHSGDHFIYPDCRPEFNAAFSEAARLGTDGKVCVRFPYSHMDKRQIGDLGRDLKVDFTRTWTCYKGGFIHCGTCGSCKERKYALRHDEGLDPTSYEK